ncbi:MAG: acrylyl-CoA reductase (NADPH) [Oceanicoccus sp.]|jgi:acrylyl-CoA reductase (NADPH)
MFNALITEKIGDKEFRTGLGQRAIEDLPAGDLLIEVQYSSLNYKDALSANGSPGVTRNFPHTPGIDAAGIVKESASEHFSVGDTVIVTGYDLGMETDGGLAEFIRVPATWALALPSGLSARDAMVLGTAGLTAGLCVNKLLQAGAVADEGKVIVTGATGGVGSVAVALLAKLGFQVVASTSKVSQHDLLKSLGATEIIDRETLAAAERKPMLKPQWQNAVDCVGGDTLVNILKSLGRSGSVACCGLVGSADLPANVLPFILRDVNLLGVDSVEIPLAKKQHIWGMFSEEWKLDCLDQLATEIQLEQVPEYLDKIIKGENIGRTVVRIK